MSANVEPATNQNQSNAGRVLTFVSALAFSLFFLFHWYQVWQWAIDVPFWDEWDTFPREPAASWIWAQHNDHRIVTTKAMIWLLWKINGWDIALHQTLNFAIFGGVLATQFCLIRKFLPAVPPVLIFLFLLCTASPAPSENHHWAFQVQWHFLLLFFFAALLCLFERPDQPQANWKLGLGTLWGVLCMASFSTGVPAMLLTAGVFAVYKGKRMQANPAHKAVELRQLLLVLLPILLFTGLYFVGYRFTSTVPKTLPTSGSYWTYFFTLISTGFGYAATLQMSLIFGGLALIFTLSPWGVAALKRPTRDSNAFLLPIAVAVVGILLAMALGTMGRAALGWEQARAGRYTEVTLMLLPLTAAALWAVLRPKPIAQYVGLTLFAAFCLLGFTSTLNNLNDYQITYFIRRNEAQRLSGCLAIPEGCKSPNLSGEPITPTDLTTAQRLGLSFSKRLFTNQW